MRWSGPAFRPRDLGSVFILSEENRVPASHICTFQILPYPSSSSSLSPLLGSCSDFNAKRSLADLSKCQNWGGGKQADWCFLQKVACEPLQDVWRI